MVEGALPYKVESIYLDNTVVVILYPSNSNSQHDMANLGPWYVWINAPVILCPPSHAGSRMLTYN